jgi:PTH2 family peptidyl-tRNA hydrolase
MLKIYVRADLKMRKGKMAAQSAHAAMKLLMEVMIKTKNKMILRHEEIKKFVEFLKNPVIEIVMVNSEEHLNLILDKSKPFSIIVDSGRTEFHGVKTVTCGAQGIFEDVALTEMEVPHIYGKDIVAKQVFLTS